MKKIVLSLVCLFTLISINSFSSTVIDPNVTKLGPTIEPSETVVTDGQIIVGNASNIGDDVSLSGDVEINSSGNVTVVGISGTTTVTQPVHLNDNVKLTAGNTSSDPDTSYWWDSSTNLNLNINKDISSGEAITINGTGALTSSSGEQRWLKIQPNINQSGTAEYKGVWIDATETSLGSSNDNSILDITNTGDPSNTINSAIDIPMAMTVDKNSIQAFQMRNLSSGNAAEMRFTVTGNDASYLSFDHPGSNNAAGNFFGLSKSTGSFIFNTSRDFAIGALTGGYDTYIGAGNTTVIKAHAERLTETLGGRIVNHTSLSADGTSTNLVDIVGVQTDSGAISFVLATVDNIEGRVMTIKDEDCNASTNNITVTAQAATIDEAASATISGDCDSIDVYSDGSNWFTR